jgi:hypothetical protein
MSTSDGEARPRFQFSPVIRLGDIVTVVGVALATISAWQRNEFRMEVLERKQAEQIVENKDLRASIQSVSIEIRQEMKDQGSTIRRIEDKINRARM